MIHKYLQINRRAFLVYAIQQPPLALKILKEKSDYFSLYNLCKYAYSCCIGELLDSFLQNTNSAPSLPTLLPKETL